jgi:hypothetical protein
MRSIKSLRFVGTVGALAVLLGAAPDTQSSSAAERFTALAVNMGQPGRWKTATVEVAVNRWSSDTERDRLLEALIERGPEKLLDTLQDLPRVGFIRTPDSIGYDVRFARQTPGEDGGERITLVTDRHIGFWEAFERPRTVDYPFTVVELRMKPDGTGEGKMSLFTRIVYDKLNKQIILEDYGTQPALLTAVRRESRG